MSDLELEDQALIDFNAAFDIYSNSGLFIGDSADDADAYFYLLLQRIQCINNQPVKTAGDLKMLQAYQAQFFERAEILTAQESARAVNEQAAEELALASPKDASNSLPRNRRDLEEMKAAKQSFEARIAAEPSALARLKSQIDANENSAILNRRMADLVAQNQADYKALEAIDARLRHEYGSLFDYRAEIVKLDPFIAKAHFGSAELYVKSFVLADHGYGVLVNKDGATPFLMADSSRSVAAVQVAQLRSSILNPASEADCKRTRRVCFGEFDFEAANRLFLMLFGPVAEQVLSAEHLVWEPDTNLIGVPLASLVTRYNGEKYDLSKDANAVAWLVSRPKAPNSAARVRLPSSISLSAPSFLKTRGDARPQATKPFYGFTYTNMPNEDMFIPTAGVGCRMNGHPPNFDFGVLSLEKISQNKSVVLSGDSFNDTDVLLLGKFGGVLGNVRVVEFETHGFVPSESSSGCLNTVDRPFLLTARNPNNQASDGILDTQKIVQMHLNADLVILAGCNTGVVWEHQSGETFGDLVTAFFGIGARNVMVTNWSTSEYGNEHIVEDFFQPAQESPQGTPRTQDEALAESQERLILGRDNEGENSYEHPGYWASFMLVGDGMRVVPDLSGDKL